MPTTRRRRIVRRAVMVFVVVVLGSVSAWFWWLDFTDAPLSPGPLRDPVPTDYRDDPGPPEMYR